MARASDSASHRPGCACSSLPPAKKLQRQGDDLPWKSDRSPCRISLWLISYIAGWPFDGSICRKKYCYLKKKYLINS